MDSDKTKSIILKGKKVIARKKGILWENAYSPHRRFMARKSCSATTGVRDMRIVKYVDMPDGQLKAVCLLTKQKIEALRSKGIKVELITPRVNGKGKKRLNFREAWVRRHGLEPAVRHQSGVWNRSGGSNQREEIAQMYWAVVDIARQMERVMLTVPDDDGHKPTGLFRDFVDEGKLAACFKKVSVDFYGIDRKEELKGSGRDVPTFMAYLFILVEHEHLGSGSFSEKGISPFFRFVKDQGIVNVQCTSRTFYNRLTDNLGIFRKRMQGESRDSRFQQDYWRRNIYLENFLKVREIFHATDYYNVLKPLLQ